MNYLMKYMTDILNITLYGTEHCHLCEQAHTILLEVAKQYPCHIEKIDIAFDAQLLDMYQTRIPVVVVDNIKRSLDWPFTYADLEKVMTHSS